MAKIAVLLVVVLVTGLVAPVSSRAEVAADYGGPDGGYGPPLGPLAFILTAGALVSCYDMFARIASSGVRLTGTAYQVNNVVLPLGQAVVGFAYANGDQVVFGFEAFPNASSSAAQIAAKVGGAFLLSTLLGNGYGYHFTPANIFAFAFLFQLAAVSCQQHFAQE
jgi:hypothetical protein